MRYVLYGSSAAVSFRCAAARFFFFAASSYPRVYRGRRHCLDVIEPPARDLYRLFSAGAAPEKPKILFSPVCGRVCVCYITRVQFYGWHYYTACAVCRRERGDFLGSSWKLIIKPRARSLAFCIFNWARRVALCRDINRVMRVRN